MQKEKVVLMKFSFLQHYYKEAVKTLAQAVHAGGKESGKVCESM